MRMNCIDSSEVTNNMAKRYALGLGAGIGFLILILDGKTAIFGAAAGIDLCVRSVIPALFPFFLLSDILVRTLWGSTLLQLPGRLFGIPEGAESILLSALLGGYPVGAREVSGAYEKGYLSKKNAVRMLTFCNQPGPAFLFGMVGPCLPEPWMAWALWGIVLTSALFVSLLTKREKAVIELPARSIPTPAEAMRNAIYVMACVCGWVILFRVITAFLERWVLWLLPPVFQTAVGGILELSNGCHLLYDIPDGGTRFILAAGMLSFGGLCVSMQTVSMLGTLPVKQYLWGKLLQTGTAILLSCAVVYGHLWYCALPVLAVAASIFRKKAVAFSKEPLYNG